VAIDRTPIQQAIALSLPKIAPMKIGTISN